MQIEKILKDNWFRVTKERKEIFKYIEQSHLLKSTDFVNYFKNISRASIFRTLNLFLKIGIVRKVSLGENIDYYELVEKSHNHEHMKCSKCNKIYSFDSNFLYEKLFKIALESWFEIETHHISIVGKCKDCAKN